MDGKENTNSEGKEDKPLQGYNPAVPGSYPPPQGNYPPGGAYPPPGSPPQGGPPQGVPPQGGPPQAGYQPQGGYAPQGPPGSYPPPGGYGPQGGYGPPQGGYGPPQGGYGHPAGPITNQPGPQGHPLSHDWMQMPQGVPNCPPGLEYLTMIDNLLVHQKVGLLEAVTGYDTANKYTVHNSLGQKVYQAVELSDSQMRTFCGSLRPFEIKILDNFGNQIMNLKRPLSCKYCCFPCCLQSLEVQAPLGNVVGVVEQEWSWWYPKFAIKNPDGDVVLRIEGPFSTWACCSDVDFKVMTADGSNQVGKISKQWAGYAKEAYTTADNFGISFPMDLDVRMKAVMLGACFLIDMMYYEDSQSSNSNSNANKGPGQQAQQQPHQPI